MGGDDIFDIRFAVVQGILLW